MNEKLHKALFEVQKELEPVVKSKNNPFFKSKYADLEAVVEATIPLLNKYGLLASQTTFLKSDSVVPLLRTSLIHVESGESIISEIPIITKDDTDPQKVIAGMTYMRRASLTTICGLVTMDDDGNSAAKTRPMPVSELKKPMAEKGDTGGVANTPKSVGVEKKVSIIAATRDTSNGTFYIKTDKDGVFKTEKEVVALMAKGRMGKGPTNILMTVDEDMEPVILDVLV